MSDVTRTARAHIQFEDGYRFDMSFPDVPGAATMRMDEAPPLGTGTGPTPSISHCSSPSTWPRTRAAWSTRTMMCALAGGTSHPSPSSVAVRRRPPRRLVAPRLTDRQANRDTVGHAEQRARSEQPADAAEHDEACDERESLRREDWLLRV